MKVDLSKQIALKDQRHEFLQSKYSDLQAQSKVRTDDLEKQFDTLRQESSTKFITQERQFTDEKASLEQKYEGMKTAMKAKE